MQLSLPPQQESPSVTPTSPPPPSDTITPRVATTHSSPLCLPQPHSTSALPFPQCSSPSQTQEVKTGSLSHNPPDRARQEGKGSSASP